MAYTTPKTWATNDVLTAADMNTYVRDNVDAIAPDGTTAQSFTPTLTASSNPTLGTGSTATGYAFRVGKLAIVTVYIAFGTSGTAAGSGNYSVGISALSGFNIDSDLVTNGMAIGSGWVFDSSASDRFLVACRANSSTTVTMLLESVTGASVSDSAPFAWSTSDSIRIVLTYFTT